MAELATKTYANAIKSFSVTVARSGSADYICDGVQDDVEIQAAVNTVNAAGGGTVFIRSGTYRISAAIVIPENVTVFGERMARQASGGVTFKTSASVSLTDMIQVTGTANPTTNADLKHDIVFENITFDGNNTTTNIVKLTNQDTVKFQNCRLIQGTNAVVTVWDSSSDPVAATISGGLYMNWCNVSANSGTAIDLQYQTQCWISNCWFTGSSVTTWINFKSSNKIHITNCEFNAATQALDFSDTATVTCNDITVMDCVFALNSGQKAIRESRTNAGSTRVTVQGTMAPGVIYDKLVGGGSIAVLNEIFTPMSVQSQATADKLLTLKGFPSQAGRYFEIQNSAGTAIAYINNGGLIFLNNGSVSTAAFAFTSELNTGMYRPSGGNLAFTVAGVQRVNLDSNGSMFVANSTTVPSSDPTGGGYLYVEAGALKYRGSSGTVTTIGNA
jgi:hypothetical protein